jgi:inner membrane protein
MDSLTQIALGSAVAASIAPARHRRAALVAGGMLGTLPDLDAIPLTLSGADPVTLMTWHRGPSHSLLVLAVAGWLVWLVLRQWWAPVREAPMRWLWAIQLALLTHPLLDAFTVYGTQLFWPSPGSPVMGASVFIIDPAYTIPLLIACAGGWWLPDRRAASWCLLAGLVLSTAYLGWSVAAKRIVEHAAEKTLAAEGLQHAARFSVPMPFNTLLWRVVVMTPDGFLEGERSLVADQGPMIFRRHASDRAALEAVAEYPSVRRLSWFARGFLKAEQHDGRLVLSDLRMGVEPDYVFRFAVAESDGQGGWRRIPAEQLNWPTTDRLRLAGLWQRIWRKPDPNGPGI